MTHARGLTDAAIAIAAVALVSCRGAPEHPASPPTLLPPSRHTPTRTLSPSIATITARWATEEARGSPTPEPPTPTPSPATRLDPLECVPLARSAPHAVPGDIVYARDGLEIYNGQTRVLTTAYTEPEDWFLEASDFPRTSPDLTLLAIEVEGPALGTVGGNTLLLLDASGKLSRITTSDADWGDVVGWLDDDTVLLSSQQPAQHMMYAMDPSAGITAPFPMPFPDQLLFGADWYPMHSVEIASFSADSLLAVYFATGPGANDARYVLWDLRMDVPLWQSPPLWGSHPLWSPDSSQFAFSADPDRPGYSPSPQPNNYDVYVISRRGEESKLTDFARWRPQQEVHIPDVVWSPDGARIAYFLGTRANPDEEYTYTLSTTSLDSLTTTVYCTEFIRTQRPQWSPDSRFLAVTGGDVIDTHTGSIFQLVEGGMPIGWLEDAP